MKKDLIASIGFHVVVALILLFVRWPSRSLDHPDVLIPIEIVDIGDVTQSNKPQKALAPKPEPKAPEKVEKVEKTEPQPESKPLPPVTEEKAVEEKQDDTSAEPEPSETEEPTEKVPEEEPEIIPEEKPDPEPKKPEPKKEEKPKPPSLPKIKPKAPLKEKPKKAQKKEEFNSVIKNILAGGAKKSTPEETSEEDEESGAEDGDDLPKGKELTISERDAVIQQLRRCWHFDTGMKNANQLIVPIRLHMNPDATIRRAEPAEPEKMSNPFYAAAVQRALNAVRNPACTPLNLPKKRYASWKDIIIDFDPSKM